MVLTVLTGGVFLYSAYTKLSPIWTFEYTLVEFLNFNWIAASVMARMLTGLEAGLGLLLVFHLFGQNKWVLKLAIGLLSLFNVYLIVLLVKYGNNVNCGCFGDTIWMNPTVSIIKNTVLILVCVLLLYFHKGLQFKGLRWVILGVTVLLLVMPFVVCPIESKEPNWTKSAHYKIDLSSLYINENLMTPSIRLDSGKHVIAFFSPFCPHCKTAAYKMHLMKKNNPTLPLFMVIGGTTSDLSEFWKDSKSQNIPYSRLDKKYFLDYTGGVFPLILWVNNGVVEAKSNFNNLDQNAIEQWVK